jgi:hypothetical protein
MTYRGPTPASEPETKAIMRMLETYNPKAIFSYHWLGSITGCGLMAATSSKTDTVYTNQCHQLAKAFIQGFFNDDTSKSRILFGCTEGSLAEWAYQT